MNNKERFLAGHIFKINENSGLVYRCKYGDSAVAYIVEASSKTPEPTWFYHCSIDAKTKWFEAHTTLLGKETVQTTVYYDNLIFVQEGGSDA